MLEKLVVWGDSLLKGVIFEAGRYQIFKDNCMAQCADYLGVKIQNRARFGCTSSKGKEILGKDLRQGQNISAAIIEFGGNDCDYRWEEVAANPNADHQPNTPLEQFEQNIQQMISALKEREIPVIMMSLPPIHSQRYFQWITSGLNRESITQYLGNDLEYIYRHQERYSLSITRLAYENNCAFIDLRDAFLVRNYSELLCADGIHPNKRGQALMRDVFVDFAQKHALATI